MLSTDCPRPTRPTTYAAPNGPETLIARLPLSEVLRRAAGAERATVRPGQVRA